MLVIGRALMSEPKVILLDEPSLGLAPMLVEEIFGVIRRLKEEQRADRAAGRAERGAGARHRRPRLCHGKRPHRARRPGRQRCARTPTSRNSISASTRPAPANPTATSSTTSAASAGCRSIGVVMAGANALDRVGRRPRPRSSLRRWITLERPPMSHAQSPRIAVIGTGGTISSLGASASTCSTIPISGRSCPAEALLDRFPETRLVAEPVPVTFRQVGSTADRARGLARIARH